MPDCRAGISPVHPHPALRGFKSNEYPLGLWRRSEFAGSQSYGYAGNGNSFKVVRRVFTDYMLPRVYHWFSFFLSFFSFRIMNACASSGSMRLIKIPDNKLSKISSL